MGQLYTIPENYMTPDQVNLFVMSMSEKGFSESQILANSRSISQITEMFRTAKTEERKKFLFCTYKLLKDMVDMAVLEQAKINREASFTLKQSEQSARPQDDS